MSGRQEGERRVVSSRDQIPGEPAGDRILTVVLILSVGAFAVMLVWLIGR
jgi:hypothetical protein